MSPSQPILEATHVGKSYAPRGLLSLLLARPPRRGGPHALRDVGFELAAGESLAIIGRNGAGKSTLLRILAGIAAPTTGHVARRGRIRSLLDLGAGLVDEMSGADNARALLGLDGLPGDARTRLAEQALAFADLGRFAGEPVRAYSSGMRLRLAYGIAIAVRPDILIADEVLAVGDEEFQRRCSHHVVEFLANGGTLVLASHNLYHVEKLCRRGLWLDAGRVRVYGPAREVTGAYRAAMESEDASRRPPLGDAQPRQGRAAASGGGHGPGARVVVHTERASPAHRVAQEEPFEVEVDLPAEHAASELHLDIRRPNDVCVARFPVRGKRLGFDSCALLPGRYRACLASRTGTLAEAAFDCVGGSRELGTVRLAHRWG